MLLFRKDKHFKQNTTNSLSTTNSARYFQQDPLNCKLTQRNNSFRKDISLIQHNKFSTAISAQQSQHDDNFKPLYRVLRLRATLGACAVVLEQSQNEDIIGVDILELEETNCALSSN